MPCEASYLAGPPHLLEVRSAELVETLDLRRASLDAGRRGQFGVTKRPDWKKRGQPTEALNARFSPWSRPMCSGDRANVERAVVA